MNGQNQLCGHSNARHRDCVGHGCASFPAFLIGFKSRLLPQSHISISQIPTTASLPQLYCPLKDHADFIGVAPANSFPMPSNKPGASRSSAEGQKPHVDRPILVSIA